MPEHPQRTDAYVFLSYASADRARAFPIADRLEAAGVPVWLDRHSIGGGTRWSAEIARGIRGCAALVLLASPAALRSRNVHQELQLAWEHDKPLVPLLLEPAPLPIEVEYVLAGRQWVEILDQPEEAWLPRALRALAGLEITAGDAGQAVTAEAPIDMIRPPASAVRRETTPGPSVARRSSGPSTTASPLSRLLARAPLVGRAAELAYLREQYDAVAAGQGGRLILISGEPGVGKTRLVQEAGLYAQEQGGRFLEGHYLRDGMAAYGPWVEALRAGLRGVGRQELAQMVGPYGPELAQAVPELVEPLEPFPAPLALSPDQQRRRLFDGITDLIIKLSHRMPLVLLLDNLQWAPDLSVLVHVTRRLGESRALILGTYREQEFKEQPTLLREWADLNRARLAIELRLQPLSELETAELVAHYFGAGPAAQLREPVYRRTHGNAFFTEEVLRSLTETGAVRRDENAWEVADASKIAIPESMKLAIEERVARLGEAGREILIQASVLGQEFGFATLRAMTGRPEDDLIAVIDQAVAARLLVDRSEEGEERFAFLDDQMQEVLYAGIPPLRRRRYHLRAGQALEEVYAGRLERYVEELARHFDEGNEVSRTIDYALQAAERNERLFHWLRVRQLYERALRALTYLPDTADVRRRRIETTLKLVSVSYMTEAPERSLSRLAEAEALAKGLLDPDGRLGNPYLTRVRHWIGRLQYTLGEYRTASRAFEQVLAAARASDEQDMILLSSASIGRVLFAEGYFARAVSLLEQVTEALERASGPWEWAVCTGMLGMCRSACGDYVTGLADVQRALSRAQASHDPRLLGTMQTHLACAHLHGGDLQQALKAGGAAAEAAERSGDPGQASVALGFRAWAESRLGHHEAAQLTIAAQKALERNLGGHLFYSDWWAAVESEIALNSSQVEEALSLAQRATVRAQSVGAIFAEGVAQRAWGQALAALDPPRWDEAEEHLGASLRSFEEGGARLEAARTRVVWGQLLRDRGDCTAAREHLEKAAVQSEASGLAEELVRTRSLLGELN